MSTYLSMANNSNNVEYSLPYAKATGCYTRRKRWVRKMKDADISLSLIKAVLTGVQVRQGPVQRVPFSDSRSAIPV